MAVLSNTGIRAGASGAGTDAYQIAKSLRLDGGDDAHLSKTFASGGSTTTWTLSFWIKGADIAQACYIFTGGTGTSSYITMDASQFRFYSSAHDLKTNARYKDPTAWYHFVVVADTTNGTDNDKTRVYVNGTRLAVGDFATHTQPSASAALGDFNSAATHYFNRLTSGSQEDMMLAEVHFVDAAAKEASDFGEFHSDTGQWVPKKYAGAYGTTGFYLKFDGTDLGEDSAGSNDWTANNLSAIQGNGNWISDGAISGAGNPSGYEWIKAFNGILSGLGAQPDDASNPTTFTFGSAISATAGTVVFYHSSATANNGSSMLVNGTYADSDNCTLLNGSAPYKYKMNTVTSFASIGNRHYGNLLGMETDGTLLVDNSFTNDCDVSNDTPTSFDDGDRGTGNYCTWNPLLITDSNDTLAQGNLEATHTAGAGWTGSLTSTFCGTIGVTSGKWYFEVTPDTSSANKCGVGITPSLRGEYYVGYAGNGIGHHDAYVYNSDWPMPSTPTAPSSFSLGDVLGVAVDMDNGFVWFSINGDWQNSGDPTSTNAASNGAYGDGFVGETMYPAVSQVGSSHGFTAMANFGARPFTYTPPSGFKAWNTYNLPDPTIAKPTAHVNSVLYTGTGSSQTISGVGFQPDLTWTIRRNGANAHYMFNSVAGVSEVLYPTDTGGADAFSDFAFTSDGFTADGTEGGFNANTNTFVAWNWDAGSAGSNTSVSAGGLNSSAYNTDSWVSDTTMTNEWAGHSLTTIFNGQAGGGIHGSLTNTLHLQWSSGTINGNVRLKLKTHGTAAHSYKDNSGTAIDISSSVTGTAAWVDLGNVNLTDYYGTCPSSGNAAEIEAIELDGKILVDSGQTPTNVPTLASAYRVNTDAGFSIVTYTGNVTSGATIAHGLNAKPDFAFFKNRETAGYNWYVYHKNLGNTHHLYLNLVSAQNDDSGAFNDTDPDSNVFTLGNTGDVNQNTKDIMAYIWSEVDGYSKFGTYEGNGNADGPVVWCGFKPAILLLKNIDDGGNWVLLDNKRLGYNPDNNSQLIPVTGAENTVDEVDFLATGFKLRTSLGWRNASAKTHIFAAWAESPFKYSNAR